MPPMGEIEDFIDHGLGPNLHGLYSIGFEQGENLLIQGIRSCRNTDRIDPAGREKGLNRLSDRQSDPLSESP